MALGASRLRVVRQLFTESLLLAVVGGLCALLLSTVVLKVLQMQRYSTASMALDWRVLAATFGAALLAALVFGLPPAFRLPAWCRVPDARGRCSWAYKSLSAACCSSCRACLVGSRQRLGAADPGFDYRQLVTISPGLREHGYTDPRRRPISICFARARRRYRASERHPRPSSRRGAAST